MPVTTEDCGRCKMSAQEGDRGTSRDDLNNEINHILARIDRVAANTGERGRFGPGRFSSRRNLEDALQDIERRILRLRELSAPLLVLGGALSPVAWLLNIPIRLLFRKQIVHNRELIELLTSLAVILREQGPTGAGSPCPADRQTQE